MNQLNIWCEDQLLGELSLNQGNWCFNYHTNWLQNTSAFELSPHFPLQVESVIDNADNKSVEWFFENLLPEGGMREALSRKAGVSEKDSFGLLTRYGKETAGALRLLPADMSYPERADYKPLSNENLHALIKQSSPSLLTADAQLHMSLAGVQNKLGVLYKEKSFFLPEGGAASSHILKPLTNSLNPPSQKITLYAGLCLII